MKGLLSFHGLFLFLALSGFIGPSPAFADDSQFLVFNIIGGVGLILGLFLFLKGFADLRKKRLMEDTPTSLIRSMAPGEVVVIGKAHDWLPLTGPFSQKACVYFEYTVEEQRTRRVGTGKDEHTETYWAVIQQGDTSETPFYVDDGTGLALVKPAKAEKVLVGEYELTPGFFSDVPPHIDQFLKTRGVDCHGLFGFSRPLRFSERAFLVGQDLYILGVCQASPTPGNAPDGAAKDICLSQGQHGEVFMVSAKSQKSLESSLGWAAFFLIFFGIVLIGGAVYFLVITNQVGRY